MLKSYPNDDCPVTLPVLLEFLKTYETNISSTQILSQNHLDFKKTRWEEKSIQCGEQNKRPQSMPISYSLACINDHKLQGTIKSKTLDL